jgi:hypothetical protein
VTIRGVPAGEITEVEMATRAVAVNKMALEKTRERRRQLDRERDAQDERIEEKTAKALVALEGLAEAEAARDAAAALVGAAVRDLLVEDVTPERTAALLEVDVTEVRRLSKVSAPEAVPALAKVGKGSGPVAGGQLHADAGARSTVTALSEQSESEDAATRAG